jgi:hypothetical protein
VLYNNNALNAEIKMLTNYLARYTYMLRYFKGKKKVKVQSTLRDMLIKMLKSYITYINATAS